MKITIKYSGSRFLLLLLLTGLCACIKQAPLKREKPMTSTLSFYQLYEQNRTEGIANFITEDFWLLSYSLLRMNMLQRIEQQQLQPFLSKVLDDLNAALPTQPMDEADRANVDFLLVLMRLDGHHPVQLSEIAEQEYLLIEQAQAIALSPLWGYRIDYSRFKPRGRYTDTSESQRYFKTMAYSGAVLFAVKASPATGISGKLADRLTQQAMRLSLILAENQSYLELQRLLDWHMGQSEDLNIQAYQWLRQSGIQNLREQREALLHYAVRHEQQPQIIDAIVNVSALQQHESVADVLTGWRFLPQRFTVDHAIFQNLVFNRTGHYLISDQPKPFPFGYALSGGRAVKGYPSANELMALAGSKEAEDWLNTQDEKQFQGYDAASQQAKLLLDHAQGLNKVHWHMLENWFSSERLYEYKLKTALGFWTWQRYIGLLYQKQSYTLSSKSAVFEQPRPSAKIAPAVQLYQDLLNLVKQHQLYDPAKEWQEFEQLLQQALLISELELQNTPLNLQQNLFLNNLDRELKSLTGNDYPVIVDVHTNTDEGLVVEEATGFANMVLNGQARGARFSHYEFKQPITQRLTQSDWLRRLQSDNLTR